MEAKKQENNKKERIGGVEPPRSFLLTADILNNIEDNELIKEDIKLHRIIFEFPEGVNDIDIFDRCRLLFSTDNFEVCYEAVLAMLEGKPVRVYLLNYDNVTKNLLTEFLITNKESDLRTHPALNKWPILVNWLVEFIVGLEEKKYPVPSYPSLANLEESQDDTKAKKKKRKVRQDEA